MIPPCTACGAQLGPHELNCRYCGTPTPLSHQRQWHDKHASAARDAALRIEAETTVDKNANYALIAALSNLLCCLLGLPGVIAVILGMRTRALARAHGLVVPGRALAAIGIGGFAIVSTLGFWIWFGLDMKQLDDHRDELRHRLEKRAAQATLDQETACWIVELRLLEQGYEDTTGVGIDHVHCDGKLIQEGDRATLPDVTFTKSSKPQQVTACLKRGARWTIDKFTTSARCDEPTVPAQPAAEPDAPRPTVGPGKKRQDPFDSRR